MALQLFPAIKFPMISFTGEIEIGRVRLKERIRPICFLVVSSGARRTVTTSDAYTGAFHRPGCVDSPTDGPLETSKDLEKANKSSAGWSRSMCSPKG